MIAVASSLPPILNPSALSQPRFAKSPIIMPALAIMNLTVWSFLPTLRFIDLQITIDAASELVVRYFEQRTLGKPLSEESCWNRFTHEDRWKAQTHFGLRGRPVNSQRWFSSAILRLAGVGLPIDVKQS